MTEPEQIAMGDYCASLMMNDTFNALHDQFKHDAFIRMMSTGANETVQREAVYATVWGLQEFLGMMKGHVEQARAIRERHDPKPSDQP
jgi:hypothetical protein